MRAIAGYGTTDFYYDGWRVMEEHGGSDLILRQYVYGNYLDECWTLDDRRGGISVANLNSAGSGTANDRRFYCCNTLYSIFALTNESGTIVEAYQYNAYGAPTVWSGAGVDTNWFTNDDVVSMTSNGAPVSAVGNFRLYTGQYWEPIDLVETGIYNYKYRWFQPDLGRFLSRDPIGYESGVNFYEYTECAPVSWTDPYGFETEAERKAREDAEYVEKMTAQFKREAAIRRAEDEARNRKAKEAQASREAQAAQIAKEAQAAQQAHAAAAKQAAANLTPASATPPKSTSGSCTTWVTKDFTRKECTPWVFIPDPTSFISGWKSLLGLATKTTGGGIWSIDCNYIVHETRVTVCTCCDGTYECGKKSVWSNQWRNNLQFGNAWVSSMQDAKPELPPKSFQDSDFWWTSEENCCDPNVKGGRTKR